MSKQLIINGTQFFRKSGLKLAAVILWVLLPETFYKLLKCLILSVLLPETIYKLYKCFCIIPVRVYDNRALLGNGGRSCEAVH